MLGGGPDDGACRRRRKARPGGPAFSRLRLRTASGPPPISPRRPSKRSRRLLVETRFVVSSAPVHRPVWGVRESQGSVGSSTTIATELRFRRDRCFEIDDPVFVDTLRGRVPACCRGRSSRSRVIALRRPGAIRECRMTLWTLTVHPIHARVSSAIRIRILLPRTVMRACAIMPTRVGMGTIIRALAGAFRCLADGTLGVVAESSRQYTRPYVILTKRDICPGQHACQ